MYPTVGLFIYLTDAFVRFITRNANDIVVHDIQKCPGKAVFLRLGLKKSVLRIRPGQYILLQCLNISSLEWHPFTVTKVHTISEIHEIAPKIQKYLSMSCRIVHLIIKAVDDPIFFGLGARN